MGTVITKPRRKMDEVWTTREGMEIEVQDMTETHVRNVLRMLIRKDLISPERLWDADGCDASIWDTF